jgi:UDP-N-acetylmuramoyl-tripeptide--D-alanyl-D-alanine ligase
MKKLFDLFYNSTGVCTDTRKIFKDCLFICLSGDNFNGNTFALEALKLGAKHVICDDKNYCNSNEIYFVENSLIYLQKLANFHRNKFKIPLIGVTGSNGKTTSKELINCVLSKKFNVLATKGNLNNHIGVPLTLLNLNSSHEIAIIEMGANKFFDIKELCEIAEPTHGIITNIGKAHLEGFINFEGILKTKKELYDAIANVNGVLFINRDDVTLNKILPKDIDFHTYGITKKNEMVMNEISGELIELNPFVKLKWSKSNYHSEEIQTQIIGKYNFYNFLAAICIGDYFIVPENLISESIASYSPTNNRSQVFKTNNNTLILDAYNANPSSMESALESFSQISNNSKYIILGDMLELGNDSKIEHQKILNFIIKLDLPCVFVGENFYEFKNSNKNNANFLHFFKNKVDSKLYLSNLNLNNNLILLKGSRGIGLEELVEIF